MRILVCNWRDLAHPRAGGAEVYGHEIARRWVRAGHEVAWCCAAVPGRPAREHVDGVDIVRAGGALGVYRAARRYFEREERGRVDVIVDGVNTRPFGCIDWQADVPVLALIHQVAREVWTYETPALLALVGRHWLEPRWLRAYRDAPVLTISASSQASLQDYGLRDVRVVPVGCAHAPRERVDKNNVPTLAFVGRLTANKRPEHALEAHARVREQIPDAQLWVIGTGPRERHLHLRAGPGVTFFGHVSARLRQRLLSQAHVLVVTSVREGWALVVDEAAAAGTVTVGYDVAGLRDSIPAAGGVLVPAAPSALAAELGQRLPESFTTPARAGWRGGAASWDEVAATILGHLQREVRASSAAGAVPRVAA